jgi:hypothetical protein
VDPGDRVEGSGTGGHARRPSIEERVAHRDELKERGADRYETLLRHLQAGHELPLPAPRPRRWRPDIHPSAGWIVAGAVAIVIVYLVLSVATGWLRAGDVATWSGPDATVQSGQRLASCPAIVERPDVYFPSWIRFDGHVYSWSPASWPIAGPAADVAYAPTGYTHDGLEILRVRSTPEGRSGEIILVRHGDAPAGALYHVVEGCT